MTKRDCGSSGRTKFVHEREEREDVTMRMQVCKYKKYIYHSEEKEGGTGRWIENYLTSYNAAFQ